MTGLRAAEQLAVGSRSHDLEGIIPRTRWPEALGEDLCALIRDLRLEISGVEPLARLDAPSHRSAAFCLRLADGGRLKARRAWNEQRAAQIAWFLRSLRSLNFPEVHGQRGRALLLDWIQGTVVTTPTDLGAIRATAALQGRLHRFEPPPECPFSEFQGPDAVAMGINKAIARLLEAGVLDPGEAQAIAKLVDRYRPVRAATGVIHTDLCPANLVVSADGRLCPIDNESLQMGCLDYDLARTWYRWPMERSTGRHFLETYGRERDTGAFVDHFPFWFVGVVLGSIVYRLGSVSRAWEVPLAHLRAMMSDPRGMGPQ